MLFYFGRTFTESVSGNRLIELTCEHCSSVYYYFLARIGRGSATAPYAIGQKRAARRAGELARRDLEKRLLHESELVPCPKCQWINESLIQGFRQTYYRGWGSGAIVIASAGSFFSLLVASILLRHPWTRNHAATTAILGSITSITLAILLLVWRKWLRNRIQPNCDFPHAPKIPAGTPLAMIRNAETGLLEAVPRPVDPFTERNGWIVFQIGVNKLPAVCCRCVEPADPAFFYTQNMMEGLSLAIPFCRSCARSWRRRKWKTGIAITLSMIGVGYLIISSMNLDEVTYWCVWGGAIVSAPFFGAFIAGWKTAPVRVRLVDQSRSIVSLSFRNDEYRKMLNLPT